MPVKDWSRYPKNWKEIRRAILERADICAWKRRMISGKCLVSIARN